MMTAAVEVRGVSRWFGELVALRDVTCDIGPGVTIVAGANGAGKSTLLAAMAGALRPSEGTVRVLGRDPARSASVFRDVGYVPQGAQLPEDLTTRQLVTLAARTAAGWRRARAVTDDLLGAFDLEPVADRRVGACSNGNRQRTRVAMAFAGDPQVVLLDEPFVGLDGAHRAELADRLRAAATNGRSVVVSSHVETGLAAVAERVVTLVGGCLVTGARATTVRIDAVGAEEVGARLVRSGLATRVERVGAGTITFETADLDAVATRVVRIAALSGTRIDRLVTGPSAAGAA